MHKSAVVLTLELTPPKNPNTKRQDFNKSWVDPVPEAGERHFAQELRSINIGDILAMPEWKEQVRVKMLVCIVYRGVWMGVIGWVCLGIEGCVFGDGW